jgi:hypothetical protein
VPPEVRSVRSVGSEVSVSAVPVLPQIRHRGDKGQDVHPESCFIISPAVDLSMNELVCFTRIASGNADDESAGSATSCHYVSIGPGICCFVTLGMLAAVCG